MHFFVLDHDTHMIYIAGKGDGNVRYYELLNEEPYVFYLSQFISGAPQRGFGCEICGSFFLLLFFQGMR